jgi:hypothetical protein
MRAAQGLHVEWVDDEAVVLDSGGGLLHYLNRPAALTYALILEHGHEDAMRRLEELFGGSPHFEQEVDALIEELRDKGLIIDEH